MAANFDNALNILKKFTKEELIHIFNIALDNAESSSSVEKSDCPWCSSNKVIRYGKKHGKQRFFCKKCKRTFLPTTNTVMSMSHQTSAVWDAMIEDTLNGNALSYSEKKLNISHQVAFNMRHKILLSLQDLETKNPSLLQDVSELDETFVLECFKGKPLPDTVDRPARKHGAKAQKRGISDEYICICTGAQRKSGVMLKAVNRAKPSTAEVAEVFKGHIGEGTLLLTDGLRSYNILETIADCSIKNVTDEKTSFYNLNTVNNLHSFIKDKYNFYRGVATKYINRYCAMFKYSYRNSDSEYRAIKDALLKPGAAIFHSIADVNELNLATI